MKRVSDIFLENVNMNVHIVPDIETLSTDSRAVILSIGAVALLENNVIGEFYINIEDPEQLTQHGFVASEDTIIWWNSPDRAKAKLNLQEDPYPLLEALKMYAEWIRAVNGKFSWGYSSDFDNVILNNAFKILNVENPIQWYNFRCLRTLANTLNIDVNRKAGTHHNALDDARNQAITLDKCLKRVTLINTLSRLFKN